MCFCVGKSHFSLCKLQMVFKNFKYVIRVIVCGLCGQSGKYCGAYNSIVGNEAIGQSICGASAYKRVVNRHAVDHGPSE